MSFACTNIKKLPIMPRMNSSSNLSAGCFREMFYNCERLEETPALPAINLGKTAYYDMFHYCRKLKQLPKLQALTLNFGAYASMFIGCENIKVSKIQTNEYQYEFRIPDSGTATVIQPDQPSD